MSKINARGGKKSNEKKSVCFQEDTVCSEQNYQRNEIFAEYQTLAVIFFFIL